MADKEAVVNGVLNAGIKQLIDAGRELCGAIGVKAAKAYEPAQKIILTLFTQYLEDGKAQIRYLVLYAKILLTVATCMVPLLIGSITAICLLAPTDYAGPFDGAIALTVIFAIAAFSCTVAGLVHLVAAAAARGELTKNAVNWIVYQINSIRGK